MELEGTHNMSAKLTRRQFLARAALGVGASVLACGGASALAVITPPVNYQETFAQGEKAVNQKYLVAYATRCGSTVEVAQAIAEELQKQGKQVDLRPIKHISDLNNYSAVVLGSAIRMGNWVPEALKFVETHQAALNNLPTAVFCVHMNNTGGDEASRSARNSYLDGVRKLIKPQSEAWFAGVIDMKKMSFLDRLITKAMKAVDKDQRDWAAIRVWGSSLATLN
jgi:menaquinone-dependent protoporphyrinogen oxidase